MLPVQPMTRAVDERLPIHFLFRHVERGGVYGACCPEKDAAPELAAFQRGAPAIVGCLYGMVLVCGLLIDPDIQFVSR
jgi:hypothetical protein